MHWFQLEGKQNVNVMQRNMHKVQPIIYSLQHVINKAFEQRVLCVVILRCY